MLDSEEFKSGADLWVPASAGHKTLSPCACCASALGELNQLMAVSDDDLSDVDYWKNKRPALPALALRTQLFVNARIYTVDENDFVASALAFKDGKILAAGSELDLREQFADADVIDVGGKTILPGFIEPHMHFLPIATIGKFEDIGPFRYPSIEQALARLRQLAADAEPNDWIMARQFDPSLQDGPAQLTRQMLDTVSTTIPVFVYNASLHFAYCNSRALEIAGIDGRTPDEPGSSFGRDEDGEPNGVLQGGRVMSMVVKHSSAQQNYDLADACFEVCERANSLGVTMFCDQGTGLSRGVHEPDIYKALSESDRMTTRLRYFLSYAIGEKWDEQEIRYGDGDELVRVTGWKIVSDGSNQGFSGLQREPYLYSDDCGVAYVEADQLKDMVLDRARKGWPIAIHANGDKAIDNALDAFENAFDAGVLTNTPCRIEHCSILHDEHIARIKKMNLSPSFLIGHVYYWGKAMRDSIFGEAKATLLDRTGACEAQNIRWTLHSDEPVTEMGPLRCIENAVTRKMWREPETILSPDERIDITTAIRAMTRDAAWQCHSEHEIGTLEAGKYADFVILENDPHDVPENTIGDIKVLETWMGGRCVYSAESTS